MLIGGKEVQVEGFTIDTDINAVSFKQSSGRTIRRSRSLSYRSNLELAFDDVDEATEFIGDLVSGPAQIPMVLEENDISPYGDELIISDTPPIPAVTINSFIGDGVDSGIELNNSQFSTFISVLATFTMDSGWTEEGCIYSMADPSNNTAFLIRLYLRLDRKVQVIVYDQSAITSGRKFVRTLDVMNLNEEIEVFFYLDLSTPSNQIQLFINGSLATIDTSNNNNITQIYTSPTTQLYCGIGAPIIGDGREDCFNGEISRLYTSTNPLAITPALTIQHATEEEHFTQSSPDTPLLNWLGGAVQGEIEISPEIPTSVGILKFYLERAPIVKVDGYNNITVELRTLLSKDNITYPSTFNPTILNELPYDWKYKEDIYNEFNNNTTLSGLNHHSQNATSGRSMRFDFKLTKTEYLELRKFIFNQRYTPFVYNSLVGGFAVNTNMVIGKYSMAFLGKLYAVTLILEEQ